MSTTITTTVFTFDELADSAKEKAREWYRQGALDYDWWDTTFDMAKTAGALLGITVDDINFTGFWSQGDGACFTGSYRYSKGWRKALEAGGGGDSLARLIEIGEALRAAQAPVFYKGTATVSRPRGNYCHEHSPDIDVDVADEEAITDALRDFMRWIYRSLEAEHDWLLADECVDESILANKYTFTADGKRFG